jgi:hypothetical protein
MSQLYEILSFKLWNYRDNYSQIEPRILGHTGMSYIITLVIKRKADVKNFGVSKLAGILNHDS